MRNILQKVSKFAKERKNRKLWYQVFCCMAAVVVFATTYALILPAITMEKEPICGLEEHVHTEECYAIVDAENAEELLAIMDSEDVSIEELDGKQIVTRVIKVADGYKCGYDEEETTAQPEETVAEVETSTEAEIVEETTAADTAEETTKAVEKETEADEAVVADEHTHSNECYAEVLTCKLEEAEAHAHDDSCYAEVEVELASDSEATDTARTETVLVCELTETEGHSHDEACYTEELICGVEGEEPVVAEKATEVEEIEVVEETTATEETTEAEETEAVEETTEAVVETEAVEETTATEETVAVEEIHVHDDSCINYKEETETYILTVSEDGEQQIGVYELICGLEEHTHDDKLCFETPDPVIETADIWETTLPEELSGDWREDLVAVAKSQVGYEATASNAVLDETGRYITYNRYADWYGDNEGDMSAMFVSFCLHYAGVDEEAFPQAAYNAEWAETLKEMDLAAAEEDEEYEALFVTTSSNAVQAGNLVFMDTDSDEEADHVAIVAEVISESDTNKIRVIEGTTKNYSVRYKNYNVTDKHILGYGVLPSQEEKQEMLLLLPAGAQIPEGYDNIYTVIEEHAGFAVQVYAPDGAIPEGAELVAELLDENGEAYGTAKDALDKEEVEYDSMVALDIHFELDGEEVEPSVPVYVCINATGLLPETADEDSLAVHHIKEETANEGDSTKTTAEVVADGAAGTGQVEANENTEKAGNDIVSAFAVDGFSTFTVTWSEMTKKLNINFVDVNGVSITSISNDGSVKVDISRFSKADDGTYEMSAGQLAYDVIGTLNKAIANDAEKLKYSFVSAYIEDKLAVTSISYHAQDGWKYKAEGSDFTDWAEADIEPTIWLVVGSTKLNVVYNDTTLNAEVNLFNYDANVNTDGTILSDGTQTNPKSYYFVAVGNEGDYVDGLQTAASSLDHLIHTNDRSGNNTHTNFRFGYNLSESGYPVIRSKDMKSIYGNLAYLFNPTTTLKRGTGNNQSSVLQGMMTDGGGLFFKDSEGYYEYDAAKHAAWYSQNENRFYLYDAVVYPKQLNASDLSAAYAKTNFLPFNDPNLSEETSYSVDGKDVYKLSQPADMWFGMTMEFDFVMPEGGLVNGNPMVFEFCGDDDVLVFVDDVLILDIGGCHSAQTATVDFSTGIISDQRVTKSGRNPNDTTTIKERFQEALNEAQTDGSLTDATKYTKDFTEDSNTFTDNTVHNLKFYYLERGASKSYCKLRFNIPTLPQNSVMVAKEVSGDPENSNKNFGFEMELKDENERPLTSVKVIDQNGNSETVELENGIVSFSLSDGETYTVVLKDGDTYSVREVGVGSEYEVQWSGSTNGTMENKSAVYLLCVNTLKPGGASVNKTISGITTEDMYLTLDAYTTGKTVTTVTAKPTDVILVLDQSGSMFYAGNVGDTSKTITLKNGAQTSNSYNIQNAMNYDEFEARADKGLYAGQHRGYYMMINDKDKTIWCVKYTDSGWVKYQMELRSLELGKVTSYCETDRYELLSENDKNYGIFYKSVYGETCDGVKTFLDKLRGTEHIRVGIVGFAGAYEKNNEYVYPGTGVYINGVFKAYYTGLYNSVDFKSNVFEDVSTETGMVDLYKTLAAYEPKYNQTATSVGLRIAKELIDKVTLTSTDIVDGETVSRKPTVVLFTDGEPTVTNKGLLYQEGDTATEHAVRLAKNLKNDGVEIFAIAPDSKEISKDTLESLASPGKVYQSASGAMPLVFETVANSVTSGATTLGIATVLRDTISEDFVRSTDKVTVQTAYYDGTSFGEAVTKVSTDSSTGETIYHCGEHTAENPCCTLRVITDENNIVEVDGFNYAKHYVTQGTEGGYKLIVKIPIEPATGNEGGTRQETNDDDNTGIYDDGNRITEFPDPYADVPTSITVKKMVDGVETTREFYFSANYQEMDGYKTTELKEADASNYLEAIPKEVSFTKEQPKQLNPCTTENSTNAWVINELICGKPFTVAEEDIPAGYILQDIIVTLDGEDITDDTDKVEKNGTGVTILSVEPGMEIIFTNYAGYELPETGGPGTGWFLTLGGLFTAFATMYFGFMQRRKSERRAR